MESGADWTMRSKIIKFALLLREAPNQRMRMEEWIGYEGEASLIPRARETPSKTKGHEVRDNEILTSNLVIQVFTYISHKWIVDPDPIICTHEST